VFGRKWAYRGINNEGAANQQREDDGKHMHRICQLKFDNYDGTLCDRLLQ